MVLDARTRSSIYEKLTPILGEQDANALMTQFPSIEADELVTKQFLRAELAELRADMSDEFRTELRGEISGLRDELRGEISGLRDELRGEISGLRDELRGEISGLRDEISGLRDQFHGELSGEVAGLRDEFRGEILALRTEMVDRFHQQTLWFGGALTAATALLAAIGLLG
jgi:hypothetical protein